MSNNIDLGPNPVGTPPTPEQAKNILSVLGAAPSSGIATFVRDNTNVKDFIVGDIPEDWKNGQTSLTGLVLGSSVTSIGSYAFYYCPGFTGSLTIPDSVTTIGSSAFFNCSSFTGSLTIGNSVTSIGSNAFNYCSGLTGSLTIPDSVTSIGDIAFYFCGGFTGSLTIPDSVTTIGSYAFYGCSNITNVQCHIAKTIIDAATNCFQGSGITTINARASDGTWTAGAGQTIGGKSGITVIKDL